MDGTLAQRARRRQPAFLSALAAPDGSPCTPASIRILTNRKLLSIYPEIGRVKLIPFARCGGRHSRRSMNTELYFLEGQSPPEAWSRSHSNRETRIFDPTHVAIKSLLFRCYAAV